MSAEFYYTLQQVRNSKQEFFHVQDCKRGASGARLRVLYADDVDSSETHRVVTVIDYEDANGDICGSGVLIEGDPNGLGVGGIKFFDFSSSAGREALAAASAPIDAFRIFEQDASGNFVQNLAEITDLPPIGFNRFLKDILLVNDEAGSYQKLVSLLDDATTATGTALGEGFDTGGGDDTITASGGDDTVYKWSRGDLTYFGGGGSDALIFEPADGTIPIPPRGVVANLTTGTGRNPFGGRLTLTSVEDVSGTAHDDLLTGNAAANFLERLINGFGFAEMAV